MYIIYSNILAGIVLEKISYIDMLYTGWNHKGKTLEVIRDFLCEVCEWRVIEFPINMLAKVRGQSFEKSKFFALPAL